MTVRLCTLTVKPVLSGHSNRRSKLTFQYRLSLNAGQKVLQNALLEHSAILLTFIKLPYAFKTFVLFIFEWQLFTLITTDDKLKTIFVTNVWSILYC